MSASTTLKPGKNELLVNSKNLNLQNSSHQVDIRFADTSVKTLQATLWYMNGRHEDIKIEKPETSDTDGRFAFELRTDEDWASQNLLAVEVQGRKRVPRRRKSKRKSANATYSRALGNKPLRPGNEVCHAKSNSKPVAPRF
jgi:alginate biosynthesis protein AlgX